MKNKFYIISIIALAGACSKPEVSNLDAKKQELEKAKSELAALNETIASLEKEIATLDPEFARQNSKAILVSTFVAEKRPFEHKVEVRGSVESRKNVLITAQTGGEIKRVYVREGQRVTKGQTLVLLDAEIIENTIAELKTALELATAVYDRQAKLWEQKVGTEIQYLQAKNNKESLERRLATAKSQRDQAVVKAPFAGTVDQLPAKEGEIASPGMPLVRLVSPADSYIKADVSERFIGKFKTGDPVEIYFPSVNQHLTSKISSVSQVINSENRTFVVEVHLPDVNFVVKPNQVVVLQLRDYLSDETLAVPTRIIQTDEDGQFIYIVDNREGKMLARKVHVTTGITSKAETEIIDGLQGSELIVNEGYRDLTEGVEVVIEKSKEEVKRIAKN
ncbi:MAG: efflux RND transporter periplasmic adaptor subunit [Cyclobacteriaceae bacterium]